MYSSRWTLNQRFYCQCMFALISIRGMPCKQHCVVCCTVASELAAKGSVEVSKHTLQVSLTPRRLQQQLGGGAAGGCRAGGEGVQITGLAISSWSGA
jgi:hypothetical protein